MVVFERKSIINGTKTMRKATSRSEIDNSLSPSRDLMIKFAKSIMKKFETFPVSPEIEVGELEEIFNHPTFRNGTAERRKEIMIQSSQSKYQSERDYSWENYYSRDLTPYLKGKNVLDLGCFTGGRGIALFEKYQMASMTGIDIIPEFIDAATQFAKLKNVNARYLIARGEDLPFADGELDTIVNFHTMEHVQDVEKTMEECYRVLHDGGVMFVSFPSYYHPTGHHLSLVTNLPFIHYFFSSKDLVRAYYEILEERGSEAKWYRRNSPDLKPWEKGNTINGASVDEFKKIVKKQNWQVLYCSHQPIGSIGRNMSKHKVMNAISILLEPLASMPILQEIFLHRITYILVKPDNSN
jgi:ubiquinone/menaquinone biosynthesis C-methylase UbiE